MERDLSPEEKTREEGLLFRYLLQTSQTRGVQEQTTNLKNQGLKTNYIPETCMIGIFNNKLHKMMGHC